MGSRRSICIAQINYNSDSIRAHLERLENIVRDNRDADLLVFPELVLHGHPSVERPAGFLLRKSKIVYGRDSSWIYRVIRDAGARVILGQIRRRGDYLYNVATYADKNGPQHYVKTHVHWTEEFVPGARLVAYDTPLGKVGINICFDSAFPEVWRSLALKGSELIVNISAVPADFPTDYMHRRMAAAALSNQVFTVYANRAGPVFSGHSAVFDPRGDPIRSVGSAESVFTAEIDPAEVARWREEEKIYPLRRPRLYRTLSKPHLVSDSALMPASDSEVAALPALPATEDWKVV